MFCSSGIFPGQIHLCTELCWSLQLQGRKRLCGDPRGRSHHGGWMLQAPSIFSLDPGLKLRAPGQGPATHQQPSPAPDFCWLAKPSSAALRIDFSWRAFRQISSHPAVHHAFPPRKPDCRVNSACASLGRELTCALQRQLPSQAVILLQCDGGSYSFSSVASAAPLDRRVPCPPTKYSLPALPVLVAGVNFV